jgi:biotin synthase-like enzyme
MVEDFDILLNQANKIYRDNFDNKVWFGRCIFLSWYCDVGTCNFCYRSTQKDKIKHAEHATRTKESIMTEALLARNLGWRIEFLTGGYRIYPFDDLIEIARLVSMIYGEKIWLNLGALKKDEILRFMPYIKGIVASIETIDESLHNEICPNKPIGPYAEMFEFIMSDKELSTLQKSITIVIGLGEKKEHFLNLAAFIEKYSLDRITFYALKPIRGTSYTKGPTTEEYAWWIASTRIRFPKLQIIAGTTADRVEEVDIILKAGANAITKFPATKMFGTDKARILEDRFKHAERVFTGTLTNLPNADWDRQIDVLDISDALKEKTKLKMQSYLKMMQNADKKFKDEVLIIEDMD